MKPTTLAFIQWLKHEMETYFLYLDRDTVATMLWQTKRIWHGIWKASLENGEEAMTTTSEKLIKQVSYRIASIWNERLPTWPTVGERDDIRDKVAAEIVDLVLSAFRDGRLDEELGVVGRGTITCTTDGQKIYQTDWKGRIPVDLAAIEQQHAWSVYEFIAFSPESQKGEGK